MNLKWVDVLEIAIQLADTYPELDPLQINFVELRQKVMQLSDFSDDPNRCGEKVLEAIQTAWIEEAQQ